MGCGPLKGWKEQGKLGIVLFQQETSIIPTEIVSGIVNIGKVFINVPQNGPLRDTRTY